MGLPSRWLAGLVSFVMSTGLVRASLECPQPVANGGEVRSGSTLRHEFHLLNRGPGTVRVIDVRSSCGCVVPRLQKRQFQPNEEAVLPIEVNTLRQGDGAHNWRIVVSYSEDGKPAELSLILAARILSEVRIEPPALAIRTETGISHTLTVTDRRPRALSVTAVESSLRDLHVRIGGPGHDSQGRPGTTLYVDVPADFPEGHHAGVLHIHTNDPHYADLEVPVSVTKESARLVRASPEEISLAGPEGAPLPSQIVLLCAAKDQPVRVESVEVDDPSLECHWAAGPGPRSTLRVRVDHHKIAGTGLTSAVRVHLASPEPGLVVVIPVKVDRSH